MSTRSHRLSVSELANCNECVVLRVSGELDQSCEDFFLHTLGASVEAGHRHLVLDVTALTFCDSRGLNCLLSVRWLLQRRGGQLLLAGAGRRLGELLLETGSAQVLPGYPTVGQACWPCRDLTVPSGRPRPLRSRRIRRATGIRGCRPSSRRHRARSVRLAGLQPLTGTFPRAGNNAPVAEDSSQSAVLKYSAGVRFSRFPARTTRAHSRRTTARRAHQAGRTVALASSAIGTLP
jgi:anti-anti-sigma factor